MNSRFDLFYHPNKPLQRTALHAATELGRYAKINKNIEDVT